MEFTRPNYSQALAFMEHILHSSKVQASLSVVFGYGEAPSVSNFNSQDPTTIRKCELCLDYMASVVEALRAEISTRPMQSEFDDPEDSEPPTKEEAEGVLRDVLNGSEPSPPLSLVGSSPMLPV